MKSGKRDWTIEELSPSMSSNKKLIRKKMWIKKYARRLDRRIAKYITY
jgi:hypothetical protein